MLAYDYPLLGVFWSMFMFALLVLWIFIVIWAFIDNFRRTDHHGVAKAHVVPLHRVRTGHRSVLLHPHSTGRPLCGRHRRLANGRSQRGSATD